MSNKASKNGKPNGFPSNFFAALERGNEDGAFDIIRDEALPDGQVPSPRAQALMETGEWDSHQKLSLVLIETTACAGKIGQDDYRFCGKPNHHCKVIQHTKNTVGSIKRGWYIAAGKQQGVFTSPYLPHAEDGGPITARAATKLVDGDNPFRMSKGMWKFVIDSWYASQVPSPVGDFSDFEEMITFDSIEKVPPTKALVQNMSLVDETKEGAR